MTRRVLITGGMGFIGGHLCEALLARGDHVTTLDNLSTGRRANVAHLLAHPSFRTVVDAVDDEAVLDALCSESDLIVHLAAAVGVELIVADPIRTIETNINGTAAVLRAAERHGLRTLLASTSEVYGKSPKLPFREDDDVVLGATSKSRWSYAASKMIDEFLGLAYAAERNVPVVVFRLFNTVGPRQTGRYGMVVPRFVHAAVEGRPLPIYGDGEQSRCFLHVSDAVDAITRLADADAAVGEVFNIGSSEKVTIRELADRVLERVDKWRGEVELVPRSARLSFVTYEQAYAAGFEDMRSRQPDTTKINRMTGWVPTHSLDDILDDVITEIASQRVIDLTPAKGPLPRSNPFTEQSESFADVVA